MSSKVPPMTFRDMPLTRDGVNAPGPHCLQDSPVEDIFQAYRSQSDLQQLGQPILLLHKWHLSYELQKMSRNGASAREARASRLDSTTTGQT